MKYLERRATRLAFLPVLVTALVALAGPSSAQVLYGSIVGSVTDPTHAAVPGATVTIPLVSGDIRMEVLGTITEVCGDRIYGFGHSFLGCGPTNLPMAGGKVYTVISSVMPRFSPTTALPVQTSLPG